MNKLEDGQTLVSLLVALALISLLIGLLVLGVQVITSEGQRVIGRSQVVDALVEVEDFMRKEFRRLEFAPFCPSLLPLVGEMVLGVGIDTEYPYQLAQSVIIYKSRNSREPSIDFNNLRGQGAARYDPRPIKNISGIVSGSDMFLVSGLLPTKMTLGSAGIVGETISDLVGIRSAKFYLTDCRSSALVIGRSAGAGFELDRADYQLVNALFKHNSLQIYVLKEYFHYVQIEGGRASFVVDALDGQAFIRVGGVVDMVVELQSEGMLSVVVAAGRRGAGRVQGAVIYPSLMDRGYQNADVIDVRNVIINLER